MPPHIVVLGAGKSASCLINYLSALPFQYNWRVTVADSDLSLVRSKLPAGSRIEPAGLDVTDAVLRGALIKQADLVIALLPPALLQMVAVDCIRFRKHFLTASYLDAQMRDLSGQVGATGKLFLCEMGLDPGIDHMSAMKRIDAIRKNGGIIDAFVSHCGGLVSPRSDDNPWHYKISWNPRNIVLAGSLGGVYRQNGQMVETPYKALFSNCETVEVPGLGRLAWYPNRDSLLYQHLYRLQDAHTCMRTTLRYPAFCPAWNAVINAGLTGTDPLPDGQVSFRNWSEPIVPYINDTNREQLAFLGLFDEEAVPAGLRSAADITQYLLETRLAMKPSDHDMIVMLHEITYRNGDLPRRLESRLVVEGKNSTETAMAATVGLPLGIAAKLILQDKIRVKGLHIPVLPEIYEPVLAELEQQGIRFVDVETDL